MTFSNYQLISGSINCTGSDLVIAKRNLFTFEIFVKQTIEANASIAWALLNDVQDYSRWHSQIAEVKGRLAHNKKLLFIFKDKAQTYSTFTIKVIRLYGLLIWKNKFITYRFKIEENGQNASLIYVNSKESFLSTALRYFNSNNCPIDMIYFVQELKKEAELIEKLKD